VILDKIRNVGSGDYESAIAEIAATNEAIDLCRAIIKGESWKRISEILKAVKGEPENIRYAVLGYARSVLLSSGSHKAYHVICCFENNFYDSKAAGLARACFEAINDK
jgi:hypothetical protein